MKKFVRFSIMFLVITLIVTVFSITTNKWSTLTNQPEWLTDLLENSLCQPPCWQNIQPGITTISEANKILTTLPWIDQESIELTEDNGQDECVKWSNISTQDFSGKICFVDSTVRFINIWLGGDELSINDLVKKIGSPESLLIISTSVETRNMMTFLLYPDAGYIFLTEYNVDISTDGTTRISSEQEVSSVWICEKQNLTEILGSTLLRSPNIVDEALQDWYGYGDYQFYDYPSFQD